MNERKIFEDLVRRPRRVMGPADEALIPGTSIFAEDLSMIAGESRLRHRVELVPNEEPAAAVPTSTTKPGPVPAIAPPAPAAPAVDPDDEEPETDREGDSRARKLRRRLARLKVEIARLDRGKK